MRDGNQMMKQTKNIIAIAFVLVAVLITASGSALAGWTSMTSGTTTDLYSDWGSSGSDVFAVGLNGTILHYNGSAWISMTSGTTEDLTDVWGSSGSDVFAMGFNGTILHYNGSA